MTRDKAIEEVKNYENYPNGLSKECRDYIVKALEQVPSSSENSNKSKNPISSTTRNCESCRYYGLHHEVCKYCYRCSLWTEKEPTTKKCITCAYREMDGKPHEMCKSCVCGDRYRQEPTTKNDLGVDCISRAEVLKLMQESMDDIRALPSVTPQEPRWIPVSEKLPKEDGEYLLFGKIDEDEENYIFIGEYDSCGEQFGIWQEQFDRTTLGCLGSEFFEYSSVLAWQPLPKPYSEVEE